MQSLIIDETEITTLDQKHESRSERYKVAQTRELAKRFRELGFNVDSYTESKTRKSSRVGYQKHMVRLSNPDVRSVSHPDVKLQILVTNAHDGSSSLRLQLGFFRFVCGNGLIVGESFDTIRIRHTGNVVEQVDRAVERIVAQSARLDEALTRMKSKRLSELEMKSFVDEAAKLRGASVYDLSVSPRRDADAETDNLFVLFNVVQEALVSGGQTYRNGRGKERVMRGISNISRLTEVNSSLFDLAMKYAA